MIPAGTAGSGRGRVLVTRPEPGLSETLQALAGLGFAPVPAPLLVIHPLAPPIPDRVQASLLTSGQAAGPLSSLAPVLRGRPLLAVGDATAARARAAGFEKVVSAAGDADRLAGTVRDHLDPSRGPVLLASGRGQGAALARRLRGDGFRVIRRCVYTARPVGILPAPALAALEQGVIDAILFFSGETAAAFVRILPPGLRDALRGIRALAVSPRAAEPLRTLRWRAVEAAAVPTAASLLALLERP